MPQGSRWSEGRPWSQEGFVIDATKAWEPGPSLDAANSATCQTKAKLCLHTSPGLRLAEERDSEPIGTRQGSSDSVDMPVQPMAYCTSARNRLLTASSETRYDACWEAMPVLGETRVRWGDGILHFRFSERHHLWHIRS